MPWLRADLARPRSSAESCCLTALRPLPHPCNMHHRCTQVHADTAAQPCHCYCRSIIPDLQQPCDRWLDAAGLVTAVSVAGLSVDAAAYFVIDPSFSAAGVYTPSLINQG